jgi:hypothetical protein
MASVFAEQIDRQKLDVTPFKVGHNLLGHQALELDTLTEVLCRLPPRQVFYSNSRLDTRDNFEATFRAPNKVVSLEETLATMRHSESLIMVNSPEVDPVFKPLYDEIMDSVRALVPAKGGKETVLMPTLYLFIASPNSVTPFHIDRYSTFLFQFRGSKTVCVAEPWDGRVVSDPDREAYVSYASTQLPWSEEREKLFTCFDFHPGESIHIPFVSGHFVRNGSEDVSISMSIIFNTAQTLMWRRALNFNHRARKLMKNLNMAPTPVGQDGFRDMSKALLWRSWLSLRGNA